MKTIFRMFGIGAALSAALSPHAFAQNEPIITVGITQIGVAAPSGSLIAVSIVSGGSGYVTPPTVTVTGGGGSGAELRAVLSGGTVTGLTVVNGGTGYTSYPSITISAPPPSNDPAIIPGTATAAVEEIGGLGTLFTHPFQNESFGEVNSPIRIYALGSGTLGSYSYQFYVNGVLLTSASGPAGIPASVTWVPPQPGAYQLTVTATGSLGHSATSNPVRYFATGTAILGPTDNTLVPNGSSVVVQATSTPAPSTAGQSAFVSRVEFFVDGALVATDSTYPYSFIYTPAPSPISHEIEARGYDNNGNLIQPVGAAMAKRRLNMVTSIGTPPLVRLVNPVNETSVPAGSAVNLIADAVAPTGFIRKVEFFVNGVPLSSTTTFPFTGSWTPQVPGRYEFRALASDDKSNVVASEPITLTATGSFPTIAIIDPPGSGLTVVQGSTLPVTVRAGGPDGGIGSIRSIEFLVDGVVSDSLPKASGTTTTTGGTTTTTTPILAEPFVFNWKSNVSVGAHRLAARVTGVNNLVITSAEITVNVVPNQVPQIALTSPSGTSSFAINVPTTLSASAADPDGTIASVDFLVNGAKIGSATKAPFEVSWTPASAGTYEIVARALDSGGAAASTEALSVVVDSPAPTAGSGQPQTSLAHTVYRGDYGSSTESGRFAFALNRNNRGTFIGYSSAPTGKTYFWTDIAVAPDGTFTVRDATNQVALTGQTSATGVSGSFSGKTFIGPVTPSGGAVAPLIVTGTLTGVPASQMVAIVGGDGSVTLYSASGTGREVGADFLTSAGNYSFNAATGGRYTGTVASNAGLVSGTVTGTVSGSFLLRQQASRITNISTRSLAGAGDRTLVAGFVVSGTGNKPLLVRAIGPTLANFGVPNPLADPNLNILRGSTSVGSNNDWGNAAPLVALAAQVGAFPLTAGSRDSAIQLSLAPGTYTSVVGGGTATLGSALIEIYDADTANPATSRVTNISTRGQVGADDALIAGFVITGDVRKRLLIRAVGPTLSSFGLTGVLADPRIEVMSGTALIASNNDWSDSASFSQVSTTSPVVGAFPLNAGSRDAALVVQLAPGSYTVQVAGAGTSTGTVLVEIYDADL